MRPARLAVIGLGGISQSVHVPLALRHAEQVELAALVDLSAERVGGFARRWGVPPEAAFSRLEDLLEALREGRLDLDAAILATTGSHGEDALRLVAAGLKVLCEKPLCTSLGEIEALRAEAARQGFDLRDRLRVGYMKEYDPAVREARERLAGVRLRAVGVEVLHPLDASQLAFARLAAPPEDLPPGPLAALEARSARCLDAAVGADLDPTLRALYGGVILGSVIHDISLLRRLTGGLGEVRHAERWGGRLPGSLHLRGRLARAEVPWSLDWHYLDGCPEYRETVTFHHEEGTIELVFGVPYVLNLPTVLRVIEARPGLGARISETRWTQQEAFEHQLLALVALTRGERPEGPGVEEAAEDLRVAQRMLRALAAAGGVPLPPSSEAARAAR